jgi:L-alanine-DL-glutamate epimerase-like enolase superfamily enzyme
MEGKWWEIRKKYGLSQSNSYGEGVGRIFYGVKITADNGCEGLMFGRLPTGSYGSGTAAGTELSKEQNIDDTAFFESKKQGLSKSWEMFGQNQYDLMDIEFIAHKLWSTGCDGSVADALCDLKGKFAGLPFHQLIGGSGMGRRRVKAYASTFCDIGTPDEYAEHAQDCYDMGYRAYKIHPYRCLNPGNNMKPAGQNTAFPEWDIEICRAVRAKVGDKMELMLDPDGIYKTLDDAIMVGKELEKLNFKWYEAPISERENWENYGKLKAVLKVPFCGPENAGGGNRTRVLWYENGWTDILRAAGGISNILELASYARIFGLKCEVHGGGWNAIHAIAAVPENTIEYYEQLLVQPGHSEFSLEHIEGDGPHFENGEIIVPMEPGIGYSPRHWPYAAERSLRSFTLE